MVLIAHKEVRMFLPALVASFVMTGPAGVIAGPDEVLKSAHAAMVKTKSLVYEATLVRMEAGGSPRSTMTGEVMMKRAVDERGVGWKLYVGGHVAPEGKGEPDKVYVAFDGVAGRSVRDAEKIIYERNAKDHENLGEFLVTQGVKDVFVWGLVTGEPLAETSAAAGATGAVGEGVKEVGGERCDVVLVASGEAPTRYFLSTTDHLPRKVEVLVREAAKDAKEAGSEGAKAKEPLLRVVSELTLSKVRIDHPIAESTFIIDVPDGYMVKAVRSAGGKDVAKGGAAKKGGENPGAGPSAPENNGLLAVGTPAPAWTLKDGEGKQVSLGDFAGKVVVLDFWGSWCPPCRAAMPSFQKIHEKYKDKGVVVVGANYERDPAADPRKFMGENGITYRLVRGAETIADKYKVPGWPTYYVIDRHGEIVFGGVGFNKAQAAEHEKALSDAIDAALEEGI